MKQFIIASVLTQFAQALVIDAPEPTSQFKAARPEDGWSPKPTSPPFHPELIKRADQNILWAPDNTCGYIDGGEDAWITCFSSRTCAASSNSADGYWTMGCCSGDGKDCEWQNNCIESVDFYSSSACDHACQQNPDILLCTESNYPYCYGYTVPGVEWGFMSCDSVKGTTNDPLWTTYAGETNARIWTSKSLAVASSAVAPLKPTSVTGDSGAASASSTASHPVSPQSISQKKSTPIGAIVGGAVGGIAVLGGIIALIVFMLLKHKRQKVGQASGSDARMSYYPPLNGMAPSGYTQYATNHGPGNTTSGYFAPAPIAVGMPVGPDAKISSAGVTATNTQAPNSGSLSPAPAYSSSADPNQASPPPAHMVPSPTASPALGVENSISAPLTSQAPAVYVPQPQQQAVELGNNSGVPSQYQGRPVYEAGGY